MKTISIVVPCYNEEANIEALAQAIKDIFRHRLGSYRYEIIFIDNDSSDASRDIIRKLCAEDKDIKGILNAKNFGQFNSPYYGTLQSSGTAVILMAADFQDPVEMIPEYVRAWEEGYKIAIGIKKTSRENFLMYRFRSLYYKIIKTLSEVEQIEHFTGFGLYDKSFIEVLRRLDDPTPFLRGIVAALNARKFLMSSRRGGQEGRAIIFTGFMMPPCFPLPLIPSLGLGLLPLWVQFPAF